MEQARWNPANAYSNYIDAFVDYKRPDQDMKEPEHKYTLHLVRAVYNDEIYRLYQKYEQAVHNRERTREEFETFYCNSPIYDDVNEPERA